MGLSRKLGGGTSRAEVPSRVDYTWSTQAYTIRDIITKFQLPCVVKLSGDAGTVLWADFRFDMRQPLLLHAARTVRKIHARSLQIREPSGELEEFGPPLAIPEDYDGWFFPVGRGKDPTYLPRHTRVEGVATSSTRQFLVTTTLPAYMPAKGATTGANKHVQHEVSIGEVLTKVGVVKGDPSVAPSSPSALVQRSRQSLRCVDENQHEVVIPFSHRSLLYDVAENYGPFGNGGGVVGAGDIQVTGQSSSGVIHTHTLVAVGNKYLPRVFRHVLGELPALPQTFTGLLRCYSVFTEETVMAATMSSTNLYSMLQESSCLELATDSSTKFKIALNASELKKTHQHAVALKTCEEQAPSYVRAIKTSFTIQPVVSDLDEVVMTMYDSGQEEGEQSYQTRPSKYHGAVQTSSASTFALNEKSSSGVVFLGAEPGATDTCDHKTSETNDVDDTESVMTDDVANSVVDTASLSDATDMLCSDGVSDAGEVEANSEFDFSWGQLKRAKSFTGSLSTLTDDTSSTATDSESEDSVTAQGGLDSSVSQDSTLTKDATSSASEDTVVLRTSAPSPVYANVPKKLSVFHSGQKDDASCETEPSVVSSTVETESCSIQDVHRTTVDNSVRSVWNITPTVEDRKEENWYSATNDGAPPVTTCDDSREGGNPIWWGDRTDDAEGDSSVAPLDFREREPTREDDGISSLERPPKITDSPPKITDKSSLTDHHQVSSKSSVDSTQGMKSALASHSLLSSRLSVKSEGSAQDLVIQRLERAFNDTTDFLKSTGPPSGQPVPSPRKGKPLSSTVHQTGNWSEDSDVNCGVRAPGACVPVVQDHWGGVPASHSSPAAPLSASASQHSLPDHHTQSAPDRQALYPLHHEAPAKDRSNFGYEYDSHENATHCQTNSQPGSDLAACEQATRHQGEGQIDLDFVKALGDRLWAVSRKSSLPRYQRLHPDMDVGVQSENQVHCHQFRKESQGAGRASSYTAPEHTISSEDGGESTESDSGDADFSQDWGCVESQQREAILTDLDLLEEEVV